MIDELTQGDHAAYVTVGPWTAHVLDYRAVFPDGGQVALLVWRCDRCGAAQHPYQDICRDCGQEIDYTRPAPPLSGDPHAT